MLPERQHVLYLWPRSLFDLLTEIPIGIYKYLLCADGYVKMYRIILGTSRGEVLVNLAFRFRALTKIPAEILGACTQVKAEAKPLLYQGSEFLLRFHAP